MSQVANNKPSSMPLKAKLGILAVMGTALLALSIYFLEYFFTAEWFTVVRFEGSAYNKLHFATLVLYTFFMPAAFTCLFLASQFAMRMTASGKRYVEFPACPAFAAFVWSFGSGLLRVNPQSPIHSLSHSPTPLLKFHISASAITSSQRAVDSWSF